MPRISSLKEPQFKLDIKPKTKIDPPEVKTVLPNRNYELEPKERLEYVQENQNKNPYQLGKQATFNEHLYKEIIPYGREVEKVAENYEQTFKKTKQLLEQIAANQNDNSEIVKSIQTILENQNKNFEPDQSIRIIEENQNLNVLEKWKVRYIEPNQNSKFDPNREINYIEENMNKDPQNGGDIKFIEKNQNFEVITPFLPVFIHENQNYEPMTERFIKFIEDNQNFEVIERKPLEGEWIGGYTGPGEPTAPTWHPPTAGKPEYRELYFHERLAKGAESFGRHAEDAWERISKLPERILEKAQKMGDEVIDEFFTAGNKIIHNAESYFTNTVERVIMAAMDDPIGLLTRPGEFAHYIEQGALDSVNQSISLVNQYVISNVNKFVDVANNFLPADKKIERLKAINPIQSFRKEDANKGKEGQPEWFGNLELQEELPFSNASNIYKSTFDDPNGEMFIQGVPDLFCDISIEPFVYTVSKDPGSDDYVIDLKSNVSGQNGKAKSDKNCYAPPPYPYEILGDYLIQDFNVQDIQLSFNESYNLGVFGNTPLVSNIILPASLNIEFIADGNLHTHKWLLSYLEYMHGAKLDPNVMRPYKMCCYKITTYTTTFYGECLYARVYIAYMTTKFNESMLGTKSIKILPTEWAIVGMMEYSKNGVEKDDNVASVWDAEKVKKVGEANEFGSSFNYQHNSAEDVIPNSLQEHAEQIAKTTNENEKFIVVSFANFIADPGYAKNEIVYDNSQINSNIMATRIKNNIDLAKKRAATYVENLENQGRKKENIAVLVGGARGIEDFEKLGTMVGAIATGTFYKGGIYAYEDNDNKMIDVKEYNKPSLVKNRRAEVLQLSKLMSNAKGKNFLKKHFGISDTLLNSTDENTKEQIWNKIKAKSEL